MAPISISVLEESTYFTVPEINGPVMFEEFESVTCTPTTETGYIRCDVAVIAAVSSVITI